MNNMVDLVKYIAESLVENPEKIEINAIDNPDNLLIELHVAPEDMGKVIGKQGRIAKSIRTVVKAATPKDSKPVFVEIM